VVMTAALLVPNPFMPYEVRMAHLRETASSNFLFGMALGWLFGRRSATPGATEFTRGEPQHAA
jgi:hypothetical protein